MKKLPKWILIGALFLGGLTFYMTVVSPDRSTTLLWTAPTGNENSEPLTDLTGYIIHCWTATGQYTNTMYVDDPSITSYEVKEFSPGEYSCAVTAISEDGGESALSNVVAKTIP
jgi:hypothetical protein